jgi:cell division septal protein FtsQ
MAEPNGGTAVAPAEPAPAAESEPEPGAQPRNRGLRRLRRPSWRVLAAGTAVCGLVAGAALLTSLRSPLGISEIAVEGAGPAVQSAVDAAVPDVVGQPFRAVDAGALADRLRAIEGIDAARVDWAWWNTLAVVVEEQKPVAIVATGDGFRVLDAQGDTIRRTAEQPPGPPLLESAEPVDHLIGLEVIQAVPNAILPQTEAVIVAPDGAGVEVRLTSGAVADLGAPERLAEKFAVLGQLLPVGAERYSVAVPERPVLQGIPAPSQP